MDNDCIRNLHLTTAYGGASPQGEAYTYQSLPLEGRRVPVALVMR